MSKETLIREIEVAKKKLAILEAKEKLENEKSSVRRLDQYTDEEKIVAFDELYNSAKEMLQEVLDKGYANEDNDHYTWEEVMELLAHKARRNDFWKYYNSLDK